MNKNLNKKGFTIIEVVLVLAIAGLIFLMVFVALPNLQRSQRDTQRRNDYSQLAANMSSYMTNNGGNLPANGADLDPAQYINATGEDPYGNEYDIVVASCTAHVANAICTGGTAINAAATDAAGSTVYIMKNATCDGVAADGSSIPDYNTSSRKFAIYGQLESGSYCQAE